MISLIPMLPEHSGPVLEIYGHGIASGMATFETKVPDWEVFNLKYLPHSRIIALKTVMNPLAGLLCRPYRQGNVIAAWRK